MTDNKKQLINKYLDEFTQLKPEDRRVVASALHEQYSLRATGRSTRQIDEYVQQLFDQGVCTVIDHSGEKFADQYLLDRVIQRVRREHPTMNFQVNGNRIRNLSYRSR